MAARLRDPLVLLAVLSVVSLAVRLAWLAEPCRKPCRSASDRVLVFDERYYVNAARVIAGIHPPPGSPYATAPLGSDPNSEHPQLAKVIMAGAIELFGDGPFAWRIGSIVFGSLALLGCFALARAAGGGRWVALGASALMAADNLLIVHGRIATLDIYALAAMIWGATFYLRGRPLAAGVTIGIGACMKLVAPYVLLALAVLEVLRSLMATPEGYATGVTQNGVTDGGSRWPPARRRPLSSSLRDSPCSIRSRRPTTRLRGRRSPAGHSHTCPTCSPTPARWPARTARAGSPPTRGSGWATTSRSCT